MMSAYYTDDDSSDPLLESTVEKNWQKKTKKYSSQQPSTDAKAGDHRASDHPPPPPYHENNDDPKLSVVYGYPVGGSHARRTSTTSSMLTWTTALAIATTCLCPMFGLPAVILAVMAQRSAESPSSDRSTSGTVRRLELGSLVFSVLGLIAFCVFIAIFVLVDVHLHVQSAVVSVATPRAMSPGTAVPAVRLTTLITATRTTKMTTSRRPITTKSVVGYVRCQQFLAANGVCYPYRINGSACDYGYRDQLDGFCYYDSRYFGGRGTACRGIGADINPLDDGFCYYSSPLVCPYSANFANGICYAYRVPLPSDTAAAVGSCPHGYRSPDDHCHYDTRIEMTSSYPPLEPSCDVFQPSSQFSANTTTTFYYCYSTRSPTVCRYSSNYVDGKCAEFAFPVTTTTCRNGRRSNSVCYYGSRRMADLRRPLVGVGLALTCPSDWDLVGAYCYRA